jgi:hypothetical protein
MKGMIRIVLTTLMLLAGYFFYTSGKHEPVMLQDLTDSPVVYEAAYLEDKPLSANQADNIVPVDVFPIAKVTTIKAVGLITKEAMAEQSNALDAKKDKATETSMDGVDGMDGIGGYYEDYTLAPEDEVAQFLDQGPIGVVDTNAPGPGFTDEFMASEGNLLMNVESVKKGVKQ